MRERGGRLGKKRQWLDAEAFARVELGLGAEEFWRLSPAQFAAYTDAWRRREERLDRRAAMTPWILANIHRKSSSPTIPITDFMPQADDTEDNRAGQLALAADLAAMAKQNPNIRETRPDGQE